jgi:hypothetical protein
MPHRSGIWTRFRRSAGLAVLAGLAALPAAAQPKANLVGTYQSWYVYTSGAGANKVCYALGQPRETQPTNVRRDPIFFLISTWPGKKTVNEPSVVPGYPYRDGSKVQVQVGADKFEFFTQNEGDEGGAWMQNPADERRLIDAMKRGATMIVTGTSTRGTLTRDTYSLQGLTAAITNVANTCK